MKNLLLFPLQKEFDLFVKNLAEQKLDITQNETSKKRAYFHVAQLDAICAKGGHGKIQHALFTERFLIEFPSIENVFCVGAGGGLSTEVNVFDLVIGSETIEHDYKIRFGENHPEPRFKGSRQWINKVESLKLAESTIHIGPIASGDEDIVDTKRAQELYEQTQALAVAWEGAGAAKAAAFNKVHFLEVRAITDNARNDVTNDFVKNLPSAMDKAAELFIQLLQ